MTLLTTRSLGKEPGRENLTEGGLLLGNPSCAMYSRITDSASSKPVSVRRAGDGGTIRTRGWRDRLQSQTSSTFRSSSTQASWPPIWPRRPLRPSPVVGAKDRVNRPVLHNQNSQSWPILLVTEPAFGRTTRPVLRRDEAWVVEEPITLPDIIQRSPFRYFRTCPEIIRLAVMLYVLCS